MRLQGLSPGVQDAEEADLRPQMLGITRDVQQGLRDGSKEQAVEYTRIGEDQWA